MGSANVYLSRYYSLHELRVYAAADPRSLQWHLSSDIGSEPAIDGIHVLVKRSRARLILCASQFMWNVSTRHRARPRYAGGSSDSHSCSNEITGLDPAGKYATGLLLENGAPCGPNKFSLGWLYLKAKPAQGCIFSRSGSSTTLLVSKRSLWGKGQHHAYVQNIPPPSSISQNPG
jgi:hypothetical protein